MKNFSLVDTNILLTGATGHLGQKIAADLAESGCTLFINGRNLNDLQVLQEQLLAKNKNIKIACFDVCNEQEIKNFFKSNKVINGIVNNAYAGKGGTILTSTAQDFRDAYEIAVVASVNIMKYGFESLLAASKTQQGASVVNIASMYGQVSPHLNVYKDAESTNPPFYGAAKAALIQLSKYAAVEFAPHAIRVNTISPGPFPSDKFQSTFPELITKLEEMVPMGRIGKPQELGGAIAFLLSNSSSFITGANLNIDGGWTAW